MALRAGRVGVRPDQVDSQGYIIGGGGGGTASVFKGNELPAADLGKNGDVYLFTSDPIVPVLSSNNDKVIAGQNSSTAYRVFDDDVSTYWTTSDRVYTDMYIGYLLTDPVIVRHVSIMPRAFNNVVQLHTFKVQGLKNGAWSDIYTGEIPNQIKNAGVWNDFYFDNNVAYDGYRILATDLNTSVTFTILGLQFYAAGDTVTTAYIKQNNQWVDLIGSDVSEDVAEELNRLKKLINKREVKNV